MKTLLLLGAVIEWSLFAMSSEAKPVTHHRTYSPTYQLDHFAWQTAGRMFMVKECPYNRDQDPGEVRCITTWGWI